MTKTTPDPPVIWHPDDAFLKNSHLFAYMQWLKQTQKLDFPDYHNLWQWSVDDPAAFWESVWQYFDIQAYTPYSAVLETAAMPGARWFTGSTLNYAEHLFRKASTDRPAILFRSERLRDPVEVSWQELEQRVAAVAGWLRRQGVGQGDRVAAFLPNIPEANIAFLAACSLGAIWSSCSPDFGVNSVLDRFRQIEPKVLIAADGYFYGGKEFSRIEAIKGLCAGLPSLEQVALIPYAGSNVELLSGLDVPVADWEKISRLSGEPLYFTPVPFDHPIWILYSSGTTGLPKAITHGHGGVLLEHYKYMAFHNDVHEGERFFWYTTTGWMMWNFLQSAWLMGGTLVLYDGSPGYPDMNVLWELAQQTGLQHFGTSAPYLVACQKAGLSPGRDFNLSALRSIGSTGSPLPPEAFDYVAERIKSNLWLCSMSGGTDVCTAFVGGCPSEPVYQGEIQCRALGCALYAFDEQGRELEDEVGEMVITKPMPSMPVFFWNDPGSARYHDSYFDMYPGIWRHGDWVRITPRNSLLILGRSDATLNRQGIRIGTAEIYRSVEQIPEVRDSLIVNLELEGGQHFMPLFVVLTDAAQLDDSLRKKIAAQLRSDYSPRHVPDVIVEVPEIPYTISGKKMEAPVKKILMGIPPEKAANLGAMRNPQSLAFFEAFRAQIPNA